jgi:hypothetical protein
MSAGAAAAAAEAERRRKEEEEEMTKYTDADLQGDWEFKIVRANTMAFRKPDVFRQVCAEEARAGWTLVEKFDDSRLRFKRPISARAGDAGLEFDPYRTHYGISPGAIVAIALASGLSVFIAIFLLIILLVKK